MSIPWGSEKKKISRDDNEVGGARLLCHDERYHDFVLSCPARGLRTIDLDDDFGHRNVYLSFVVSHDGNKSHDNLFDADRKDGAVPCIHLPGPSLPSVDCDWNCYPTDPL